MIQNAKDKNLAISSTGLPFVGDVIMGWFQPMTFGIIVKQQVNGYTQEIVTQQRSYGVRMPATPEQLALKAEGERSWSWSDVYASPDVLLNTDDRVIILGVKYRVMTKANYLEYGYILYSVIEDYDDNPSVTL